MVERIKRAAYNALRKSERYTKTDMLYLTKGGSWLTAGHIVTSILAFITSIAFANLIEKETFGAYRFVLSIAGIMGVFSLSGMSIAATQAIARGFDNTLRAAFRETLVWSIPMFVISAGVGIYYYIRGDLVLALSLALIAFLNPLLLSAGLYNALLTGKKDFRSFFVYNSVRAAIPALAMVSILFMTDSVVWLVVTYFGTHTLVAMVLYLCAISRIPHSATVDNSALMYGKHLSAANMLAAVANHADKILLFHFLGAAEVAIYTFATIIPDQVKGLFKNVRPLALSKFSNRTKDDVKSGLVRKSLLLLAVTSVVTMLYMVAAPTLFTFAYPQYTEAIVLSQVYAFSILFMSGAFVAVLIESHKLVRIKYKLSIISSIVRLILSVALVIPYGIWGAVIAVLLAELVTILLGFFFAYRA
jgi:O-antigen/teichoic acid export membrane protein